MRAPSTFRATSIFAAFAVVATSFIGLGVTAGVAEASSQRFRDPSTGRWVTKKRAGRRRAVPSRFRRRTVRLRTRHRAGTVIVDTKKKYLYLVRGNNRAIRYGIGVGREGFGWGGTVRVAHKAKWPSWTPPKEMIEREWRENRRRVSYMKGGPKNPLGARALYLYKGGGDTGYRIHGTNEPWSIGLNMSSGCIRLLNKDVSDLYSRVRVGAKVVVIGPGGPSRRQTYATGLFGLGG